MCTASRPPLLLWLVPPLVQRMRQWSAQRIWRAAVPMLSVHLAAAASSAIPGAVLFGSVSLIAPMVNLLVVPVMVLALLSTLVTLLAGWFAPTLGAVVGWTPSMLVSVADAVILTTAALQPDVPERAVPLAAILVTASVAWLLRASTPRYAAFRLIAGTLAIVTVVSMPPDPQHGVICRRIGDRVEVRATVPSEERRFVIGQRYGRPFVRSYRDRHSSHRAP